MPPEEETDPAYRSFLADEFSGGKGRDGSESKESFCDGRVYFREKRVVFDQDRAKLIHNVMIFYIFSFEIGQIKLLCM
jgi:hypothetical protein